MLGSPASGARINSFELVSYIPDPLGAFLDRLRRELVPGCAARSHVTVLCPRQLEVPAEVATGQLLHRLQGVQPFTLEVTGIELFEATSVAYLGIGTGSLELHQLHEALNTGDLHSDEPHSFHPHITLAQNFDPVLVPQVLDQARRSWAGFTGPRRYRLDTLTFVQNTADNSWLDLEEFPLRPCDRGQTALAL